MSPESPRETIYESQESGPEQLPSKQEVMSLLTSLIEGTDYRITKEEFDEGTRKGIVRIETPDGQLTKEITYSNTNTANEGCIDFAFFDADGDYVGGASYSKWDPNERVWVKQ